MRDLAYALGVEEKPVASPEACGKKERIKYCMGIPAAHLSQLVAEKRSLTEIKVSFLTPLFPSGMKVPSKRP
jgi:hypothetical protein